MAVNDPETPGTQYVNVRPLSTQGKRCSVLAQVDSGNTFRNVISPACMAAFGITKDDLRPVHGIRLSTAKSGTYLKMLGELKRPVKVRLGDYQKPFRFDAVVVEGMTQDANISLSALRNWGVDQMHTLGCLRHQGKDISLVNRSGEKVLPRQIATLFVSKDTRVAPNSIMYFPVESPDFKDGPEKGVAGTIIGDGKFSENTKLFPVQKLSTGMLPGGKSVASVMNLEGHEILLRKGTRYGHFLPTLEDPEVEERSINLIRPTQIIPETKEEMILQEADVIQLEVGRRQKLAEAFDLANNPLLARKEHLDAAISLLCQYEDVFSFDGSFGQTQLIEHEIHTLDHPPIKCRYRPINPALEPNLRKQLDTWTAHGVIEDSNSPWCFALVAVPKKNGKMRWCVDYRRLNDITIKDAYPLPHIEDNLVRLAHSTMFSAIDGSGAFHVVPMRMEDRPKTAFATPWGQKQFCRMPFGLSNAPATYSRLVNRVLQDIPTEMALPYLDDTLIHSPGFETHLKALARVLQAHRVAGLKLQPSKCLLFRSKVDYLGHYVSAEGISPSAQLRADRPRLAHARHQDGGSILCGQDELLPSIHQGLLRKGSAHERLTEEGKGSGQGNQGQRAVTCFS